MIRILHAIEELQLPYILKTFQVPLSEIPQIVTWSNCINPIICQQTRTLQQQTNCQQPQDHHHTSSHKPPFSVSSTELSRILSRLLCIISSGAPRTRPYSNAVVIERRF